MGTIFTEETVPSMRMLETNSATSLGVWISLGSDTKRIASTMCEEERTIEEDILIWFGDLIETD